MTDYKVMTLNMLTDHLYQYGKMNFSLRINAINRLIDEYKPDIIGVQELTSRMMCRMNHILEDYGMFGDSRHSLLADEYNSILYRKDCFELIGGNTYWLSEHPEETGSRVAMSQFPRIAVCAHLRNIKTNQSIAFWNTHFDVNLESVRIRQASILSELIYRKSLCASIILTGDFNSVSPDVICMLEHHGMNNLDPDDLGSTLRGQIGSLKVHNRPIDAIYTTGTGISLDKITKKYNDICPSDHYPLFSVISFPR